MKFEKIATHPWKIWSGLVVELLVGLLVWILAGGETLLWLAIYFGVGEIVCMARKSVPTPLPERVDLVWGFRYLYWRLWWPIYLCRKH